MAPTNFKMTTLPYLLKFGYSNNLNGSVIIKLDINVVISFV